MMTNRDGNRDAYSTIVKTTSGSVYEISFIDDDWKIKRQGKTRTGDGEWITLLTYPEIEIGREMTLHMDGTKWDCLAVIRYTTDVVDVKTGEMWLQ